jgi:hypothetical protein
MTQWSGSRSDRGCANAASGRGETGSGGRTSRDGRSSISRPSQWGSRDDVRFTINLHVGVPQRLGALIADGEDRWWSVDADTDVVQLAEELRTLLADHALPWLEERPSLEQLLDHRGPAVPRYLIWS